MYKGNINTSENKQMDKEEKENGTIIKWSNKTYKSSIFPQMGYTRLQLIGTHMDLYHIPKLSKHAIN